MSGMVGVSEILKNVMYEKLKGCVGSTYKVEAEFTHSSSGFNLKPERIDKINISQDFTQSVVDTIEMDCKFFPKDLVQILNNAQDLKCNIIQRRWSRDFYDVVSSEEPDVYNFKVMISNPQDLLKAIPPAALQETENAEIDRGQLKNPLPLSMQLIPDVDYEVFKQKGNVMLADTDMQSVILYMAKLFGIKNTHVVKPDDDKKFENVIIPAVTDLAALIPKLQQDYGIYNKGASSYFCGNTLYVYPPFDTNPDKTEIVNIYRFPEKSLDGGDTYHKQNSDNELHVVTFSKVSGQNAAPASNENVGNAVAVRQADTSMDISRDVSNDGTITLNNQASIVAKINNSNTNNSSQVNIDHNGTTANMFDALSKLSSGQIEHVGLAWIHAKPWLIIPGMKVVLHYDDLDQTTGKNVYSTAVGIVEGCVYVLSRQGRPDEKIYRWDAVLALGIAPKEVDASQTTPASPNT